VKITKRQLRRIIGEAVASWKRTPGTTGKRRLKGEKEFTLRVRQEEELDFVVLAHDEQQARDDLELFLNQGMPMEELRAGKWHSIQLLDKFDWDARITKSGAGTDYSRDRMGWEMKDEQLTETIEKLANGKFRLYSYQGMLGELRSYIRSLLTEAARRPYDLPDGWAVYVDNVGEEYRIELTGNDRSIGSITLGPAGQESEPCLGAYKINMSHAEHGWGPMLYDVAMEIASMYASGLIPDRLDVSPEARKVWQYYHDNRPDVEVVQLDDIWNTLTPDEYDNCLQDVARGDVVYPDEWTDSPLSKLYGVDGSPTIDKLKSMGRIHFEAPR